MAKRADATQDATVEVGDLRFDLNNPRMPTELFDDEDKHIRYLIDEFDVEELLPWILSSGWIDYEPLIAERGTNLVYEGNRRLAALRLIQDAGLRRRMNYRLPTINNTQPAPETVRVRFVLVGKKHGVSLHSNTSTDRSNGTPSQKRSMLPNG